MPTSPSPDIPQIREQLLKSYRLHIASAEPTVGGFDFNARSFRIRDVEGGDYFLKLRRNPFRLASLRVPTILAENGVPNLLPPIETTAGDLFTSFGNEFAVLYPFVDGENAKERPPTTDQWKQVGRTLRAIHSTPLYHEQIADSRALDDAHIALLESALTNTSHFQAGTAAFQFASFLQIKKGSIVKLLERRQTLGAALAQKQLPNVLCHADCHQWNILVADEGRLFLLDWDDGPILAPRERDLFLILSKDQEHPTLKDLAILEGYGDYEIDLDALAYFQVDRVLEDIALSARDVFHNDHLSEESKLEIIAQAPHFFDWC